jgi:hypothetical protein
LQAMAADCVSFPLFHPHYWQSQHRLYINNKVRFTHHGSQISHNPIKGAEAHRNNNEVGLRGQAPLSAFEFPLLHFSLIVYCFDCVGPRISIAGYWYYPSRR